LADAVFFFGKSGVRTGKTCRSFHFSVKLSVYQLFRKKKSFFSIEFEKRIDFINNAGSNIEECYNKNTDRHVNKGAENNETSISGQRQHILPKSTGSQRRCQEFYGQCGYQRQPRRL